MRRTSTWRDVVDEGCAYSFLALPLFERRPDVASRHETPRQGCVPTWDEVGTTDSHDGIGHAAGGSNRDSSSVRVQRRNANKEAFSVPDDGPTVPESGPGHCVPGLGVEVRARGSSRGPRAWDRCLAHREYVLERRYRCRRRAPRISRSARLRRRSRMSIVATKVSPPLRRTHTERGDTRRRRFGACVVRPTPTAVYGKFP